MWTCFLLPWQGAAAVSVCEITAQNVEVSLRGFCVLDALCWYVRDSDVWKLKVCVVWQLILCLSYLLAALERSSWSNEYTLHVFRSLLPFIASPKAKACRCHIVLNYFYIHTGYWFWDCNEIYVSMAHYIKYFWRIQRNIIGTVLCCIVYCKCAQSQACSLLCVCFCTISELRSVILGLYFCFFCAYFLSVIVISIFEFDFRYQCNKLFAKTYLQNDLLLAESDIKHCSLSHWLNYCHLFLLY